MSKEEIEKIKAKIYKQVAELEDETALQMLEEAATAYTVSPSGDIIDKLTTVQQERLMQSAQQIKEGKTYTNEEVNQKSKEWLSR